MMRSFGLILMIVLVVGACSAPSTRPQATVQRADVIYSDDFSSGFDWDNREQGRVRIGVEAGAYRMVSNSTQYVRGFNNHVHDDVVIEVEALYLAANDTNAFGVVCRASPGDAAGGYYFLIGSDGSYSIRKGGGGDIRALVSWARSSAINTGTARNRIQVTCVGDYLALRVNGELVAQTRDSSYASGFMGFAIATEDGTLAEVAFDDVRMWAATLAEN